MPGEVALLSFGNSTPLNSFRVDAETMSPTSFRQQHGDAFLVVHRLDMLGRGADASTTMHLEPTTRPKANVAAVGESPAVIFLIKKGATSTFDWVSVGRHEGNDICLPHGSISRFHALFRLAEPGVTLQDAKSANGTFVAGERAPRAGEGEPRALEPGATLRFGDITATYLSAEGLIALLAPARQGRGA
jgi:FHA domain